MRRAERWPDGMATFAEANALRRGLDIARAAFEALGELTGPDLDRQLQVLESVVEAMGYSSLGMAGFPQTVTPAALVHNLNLECAFTRGRARAERHADSEPDPDDGRDAWLELVDANDAEIPEERRELLAAVAGLSVQKLPLAFVDVFAEALAWRYYTRWETIGCLQELVRIHASARSLRGGFRLALPSLGRMVDLDMSPRRCVDEIREALGAG